jgi:hypothetical protein
VRFVLEVSHDIMYLQIVCKKEKTMSLRNERVRKELMRDISEIKIGIESKMQEEQLAKALGG